LFPPVGRETIDRLMPTEHPQRRRIRLAPTAYADIGEICSITIAVKGRMPVFANPAVAAAGDVLRRHAAVADVPVYAWCVMPDHVHLLLGASPSCDIVTFVGQFKNLAQREAWRLGVKGAFWQTSFWDHFLRGDEQLAHAIEYVLNNPVRSGLVERWCNYRFSGSIVFELADAGGGQAPALRLRLPPP
jgi:putative transposase